VFAEPGSSVSIRASTSIMPQYAHVNVEHLTASIHVSSWKNQRSATSSRP
jgi:hypothetical protein